MKQRYAIEDDEMMFRIGEFSKLTQVSIRMLRYYDEVGLLTPAEVDKWTGHRLYSVEQIPRLNKILYFIFGKLDFPQFFLFNPYSVFYLYALFVHLRKK